MVVDTEENEATVYELDPQENLPCGPGGLTVVEKVGTAPFSGQMLAAVIGLPAAPGALG